MSRENNWQMLVSARQFLCLAVLFVERLVCGSELAIDSRPTLHRPSTIESPLSLRGSKKNGKETVTSEFSDEDEYAYSAHSSAKKTVSKFNTGFQMKKVSGKIEFFYDPQGVTPIKTVQLCGSWSGWKQRQDLTLDASREQWRGDFDNIPHGLHHFKVIIFKTKQNEQWH